MDTKPLLPVSRADLAKTILSRLVALVIFAAAIWAIRHLVDEIDFGEVMHLVRGTPPHIVAIAFVSMLGSYCAMTGYDWSALRYLGKTLPLRVSMAGAFLGFAIAANIGGGPVASGAVRYRIYAPYGLSLRHIASIAAFGSIAFGLGMTVIGTGALAIHPRALSMMTSFSPEIIRWTSITVFLVCVFGVGALAVFRARITFRKITIRAPSLGLVSAQLVITAVDFLLAAATLYLLLPSNDIGVLPFLAVFTAAVTVSVISHVPGGVGVFEMMILASIPANIPLESAAAGLLLFRVIYYFAPFIIALVTLSIIEIVRMRRRSRPQG
ncbi:MAG: lysylphosphatidylglycerol synthase domain-containing protein [Sulfitobacter sp.]